MPVLHDALDRSFQLAAAMDSRGYGRSHDVPRRVRRTTTGLLLTGLLGICLGTYGLLDTSTPRVVGAPALALGVALSAAGLALGSRRVRRTQYRPDPWRFPEWSTAISGAVAAATVIAVGINDASALNPSLFPLAWPTLPLVPVLGILCALAPLVCTPPPPLDARRPHRASPAPPPARQPVGAAA